MTTNIRWHTENYPEAVSYWVAAGDWWRMTYPNVTNPYDTPLYQDASGKFVTEFLGPPLVDEEPAGFAERRFDAELVDVP